MAGVAVLKAWPKKVPVPFSAQAQQPQELKLDL